MIRLRLAPIAIRTAISRCLAKPRARRRFATLGATDQQEHCRSQHQEPERRARYTQSAVRKQPHHQRALSVRGRKVMAESRTDRNEVVLGLNQRDAGSQSRDHTKRVSVGSRVQRIQLQWHVELDVWLRRSRGPPSQRKVKLRRHHPDHQTVFARIDFHSPADNIAVAAKSAHPQTVTEDHFLRSARLILFL